MGDGATNVRYEAIATFEEALGRFAQASRERMKVAETTIRRTAESLEGRRSERRREILQLQDEISAADEEEDTSRAQQRLEEAEEALANVRFWQAEIEAAAQRYSREAEKLEHVSTAATAEARAYLRGLLADLAAYFALQKDGSTIPALGVIAGSNSTQGTARGVNSMDLTDTEAVDSSAASAEADAEAFRRRQGVLAFEAKTKEYQRRISQYPELSSLAPEEYLAINRYSQYDFENINAALRGDDASEKMVWGHTSGSPPER